MDKPLDLSGSKVLTILLESFGSIMLLGLTVLFVLCLFKGAFRSPP